MDNVVEKILKNTSKSECIEYSLVAVMGESFIAVKKNWKISQVVMVITSEILNLSQVVITINHE